MKTVSCRRLKMMKRMSCWVTMMVQVRVMMISVSRAITMLVYARWKSVSISKPTQTKRRNNQHLEHTYKNDALDETAVIDDAAKSAVSRKRDVHDCRLFCHIAQSQFNTVNDVKLYVRLCCDFASSIIVIIISYSHSTPYTPPASPIDTLDTLTSASDRRDAIRNEFMHAWHAYTHHAYGEDELKPVSMHGDGSYHMGLTMIDALDTMIIMGVDQSYIDECIEWIEAHLSFTQPREHQRVRDDDPGRWRLACILFTHSASTSFDRKRSTLRMHCCSHLIRRRSYRMEQWDWEVRRSITRVGRVVRARWPKVCYPVCLCIVQYACWKRFLRCLRAVGLNPNGIRVCVSSHTRRHLSHARRTRLLSPFLAPLRSVPNVHLSGKRSMHIIDDHVRRTRLIACMSICSSYMCWQAWIR